MEEGQKYYNVKVTLFLETKVKENYLVAATSVTDAEAITVKDLKESTFEFEITSVAVTTIVKVLS